MENNNIVDDHELVNDDGEILQPHELGLKPEDVKLPVKEETKDEFIVKDTQTNIKEYTDEYVEETDTQEDEFKTIEEDIQIAKDYPLKKDSIYKDVDSDIMNLKSNKLLDLPTIPYSKYYDFVRKANYLPKEDATNPVISLPLYTNVSREGYMVSPITFGGFTVNNPSTVIRDGVTIASTIVEKKKANTNKKYRVIKSVSNILNGGKDMQVPLYNSGFRVTFKFPPSDELYAIKKELRDTAILNEINTGGFLFNSTKIDIVSKIIDYAMRYVVDSTLEYDMEKNKLIDFIKPEDYPLIIAGWASAILPHGNTTTITCKNTTEFEEVTKTNSKGEESIVTLPKCNFMATATISIRDLVKVKEDRITDTMFNILAKRASKSVTIEEYRTYQKERLEFMPVKDTIVFEGNGSKLEFKLHTSSLSNYMNIGELYKNHLESELYSLGAQIDSNDSKEIKEKKMLALAELQELNRLSSYNHYIKQVIIDEEVIDLTDKDNLEKNVEMLHDILTELNSDETTLEYYLSRLYEYMSYISLAGIAVETYTCPECGMKQTEDEEPIWMDPLSFFSQILDYKFTNIID